MATLMHVSLTAGNVILMPLAREVGGPTWSLVLAVALWGVVAAVALASRGQFSHPPNHPFEWSQ